MIDSEGRTARDLASTRNDGDIVEVFTNFSSSSESQFKVETKTEEILATSESNVSIKEMTLEEEKDKLKKRLAELEEKEARSLEDRLKELNKAVESIKLDYTMKRENARSEILKLEQKIKLLHSEELEKTSELEKEIEKVSNDIKRRKGTEKPERNKDIVSCLECPVCLEVCKPPLQVIYFNFLSSG